MFIFYIDKPVKRNHVNLWKIRFCAVENHFRQPYLPERFTRFENFIFLTKYNCISQINIKILMTHYSNFITHFFKQASNQVAAIKMLKDFEPERDQQQSNFFY